jgi:hypothetical protein
VLENRVLRRIFGPKREEGTGDWRKLCNNFIWMIKSRMMRWEGVLYAWKN